MRLNKAFVFTLIIIASILFILVFMYNKAVPIITTLCETSAKYIALEVTNEAVSECISNIKYDNLVTLKQDANGKLIAINADVMELNRISTEISTNVSNKLSNIEDRYIKVPITSVFNMSLFSGYGPKIALSIIPAGNVTAKFKSEFEEAGINQTRHRIYIEITSKVRLIAPFYTSSQEYINEVTVAEYVIVGDIPESYYNINGMKDLNTDSSLDIIK
jgi:sporulation protein YunB